jgi:hypothetical protein
MEKIKALPRKIKAAIIIILIALGTIVGIFSPVLFPPTPPTRTAGPVTVSTASVNTALQYPYQGHIVHSTLADMWYVFFHNGSDIRYCNSSDGVTFSASILYKTYGTSGSQFSIALNDSANTLHIAYSTGAAGVPLNYSRATINADGSLTWGADWIVGQDPANGLVAPNIAFDTVNHPFITYKFYRTSYTYPYCTASSTTDGSWVNASWAPYQLNSTNGGTSGWGSSGVFSIESGKMLAIYTRSTTYPICSKEFDGTSTWGSEKNATITAPTTQNSWSATVDSSFNVHLISTNLTTLNLNYFKYTTSTSTWSTPEETAVSAIGAVAPAIGFSSYNSTNYIYIFWTNATYHVYYRSRNFTSGTWAATIDWQSEVNTANYLGLSCTMKDVGRQFGVAWMNGTANPYQVRFQFLDEIPADTTAYITQESNVDSQPNNGTHSNFTAQQYGPDSIIDTMTEENVAETVPEKISYGGSNTLPIYGGIARIQYKNGYATATTTISCTLTSTPIQYNTLILTSGSRRTGGTVYISSISQTGVTWTVQIRKSYTIYAEIWMGQVTSASAGTLITATYSQSLGTNGYGVINVCEYSNIALDVPLDKTASAGASSQYPLTGTTATTTATYELWVGCTVSLLNTQYTPTNGFTLIDGVKVDGENGLSNAFLEKIVSSKTTAYSSTSQGGTANYAGCIATFRRAGSDSVWSTPIAAYDNATAAAATYTFNTGGWSQYLIVNMSYSTKGTHVEMWPQRAVTTITTVQIDISNQTSSWVSVYDATPAAWNAWMNATFTLSSYTALRIRFRNTALGSVATLYEIRGYNDTVVGVTNYRLELEEQFTGLDLTTANAELDICMTNVGTEQLSVKWRNVTDSTWVTIINYLVAGWNNISFITYRTAIFTIKFVDVTITGDPTQSTWIKDCTVVHSWGGFGPTNTALADSGENRFGYDCTFYSNWTNAGWVKFRWNGTGEWVNGTQELVSEPTAYSITKTFPTSNETCTAVSYLFYAGNNDSETASNTTVITLQYSTDWETLHVDGVNATTSNGWTENDVTPYIDEYEGSPTGYINTSCTDLTSPVYSHAFSIESTTMSYNASLFEMEVKINHRETGTYARTLFDYCENGMWFNASTSSLPYRGSYQNDTITLTGLDLTSVNGFEFRFGTWSAGDCYVDYVEVRVRAWSLVNRMRYYMDGNLINWTASTWTEYLGVVFGKKTIADLEAYIDSLDDTNPAPYENYLNILRWSARCKKLGIERETAIRNALGNITRIGDSNTALPNTTKCAYAPHASEDAFSVYDRDVLYSVYYYGGRYGLTSTWNVTRGYEYFSQAVTNGSWSDDPNAQIGANNITCLWVFDDNESQTWTNRFYDEDAETLSCYLVFYELGASGALQKALDIWNHVNVVCWNETMGGFQYRPDQAVWECESAYFLRIIAELKYWYGDLGNATRIFTDIYDRYLENSYLSHQWILRDALTNSTFVVVHANPINPERRIGNTLGAWTTMLSAYYVFNDTGKTNMKNMLSYAWTRIYHENSETDENSTEAVILQLINGIIPDTTPLAFPLEELSYEYDSNIDPDLLGVNAENNTLKVGVQAAGTLKFLFGDSTASYNFADDGVWNVTFSANWSEIISVSRVSNLPTRKYLVSPYFTDYSVTGVNGTDQPVGLNVQVHDWGEVSIAELYWNYTGEMAYHSSIALSGSDDWARFNVTGPPVPHTLAWYIYANNSQNIWGNSTVKYTTFTDMTAPVPSETYGLNTTWAGYNCGFYWVWSDNILLDSWSFETNNTGTNTTSYGSFNLDVWSNNTITLNGTVPNTISWRFGANDSSNNWGYAPWQYTDLTFLTTLTQGWNSLTATGLDVSKTLGEMNASLNLDSINWTAITVDYLNGTQWSMIFNTSYNSDKLITSGSTLWVYCTDVTAAWNHKYG